MPKSLPSKIRLTWAMGGKIQPLTDTGKRMSNSLENGEYLSPEKRGRVGIEEPYFLHMYQPSSSVSGRTTIFCRLPTYCCCLCVIPLSTL